MLLFFSLPVFCQTDSVEVVSVKEFGWTIKFPRAYTKVKKEDSNYSDELATIKFRYKKPDGDKSIEIVSTIADKKVSLNNHAPFYHLLDYDNFLYHENI